jgi:hypothetical protein
MLKYAAIAATLALSIAAPPAGAAESGSTLLVANTSGLAAQDINGVQIGMTVREVAALAGGRMESLGRGQFQTSINGVQYDLGFTPLGHLYRIDSTQPLGRFVPDRAFGLNLTERLARKFGPPTSNQLPGGPAFWVYNEPYVSTQGAVLGRPTANLSAMLGGGYGQPVSLIMKLVDFRVLRHDQEAMNAKPETEAGAALKF